jgi:hypothetical protein
MTTIADGNRSAMQTDTRYWLRDLMLRVKDVPGRLGALPPNTDQHRRAVLALEEQRLRGELDKWLAVASKRETAAEHAGLLALHELAHRLTVLEHRLEQLEAEAGEGEARVQGGAQAQAQAEAKDRARRSAGGKARAEKKRKEAAGFRKWAWPLFDEAYTRLEANGRQCIGRDALAPMARSDYQEDSAAPGATWTPSGCLAVANAVTASARPALWAPYCIAAGRACSCRKRKASEKQRVMQIMGELSFVGNQVARSVANEQGIDDADRKRLTRTAARTYLETRRKTSR